MPDPNKMELNRTVNPDSIVTEYYHFDTQQTTIETEPILYGTDSEDRCEWTDPQVQEEEE